MADDLVLTHQEVMILLSGHAARGSIGAAIALERALRQAEKDREADPVGDAINAILKSDATGHELPEHDAIRSDTT